MPFVRLLLLWCVTVAPAPVLAALREPVHPRRNVEEFAATPARFVRFTVRATNRGEPCLDELEIYAANNGSRNVALAANGARATASGSLPGYAIHQLEGLNDGRYGNGRSWIAERIAGAWVQIELPEIIPIHKIVWGRDREGNFIDRLATQYEIQVAVDTNHWRTVASSNDREPLPADAQQFSGNSIARSLVNRFAPVGTTLSPEAGQSPSDYRIDVWQTSDGLPGNTVTTIQQTPDGYLWLGTFNGLVRFDGVRFQVFGEASELPNSRILALLAARDGALWIGTDGGGLARYLDGKFTVLTRKDGLNSDTVPALAEDRAGRIWVGTAAGLNCWQEGRLTEPAFASAEHGRPIPVVLIDAQDVLWVVSEVRLLMRRGQEALSRPAASDPSSFSGVLAAEAGHSGQLWFGGPNGYVGAVSNDTVHVFREQPGQLLETTWALCETRHGDLWAGTANGGLRRLRDGRFTSLTTQEGLSDNSVRCLFEDREGNLWVGTVGGGLNRLKSRKLTSFTTRDGLAHNVVMALAEDADGTLWVGSNCGGLSTRRSGVFAPFYANYLLDNECIWALLPARDGALWVGAWGGLFRLRGREVESFSVSGTHAEDPVIALGEDNADGLWVGTMKGGLKHFRNGEIVADMKSNGLPAVAVTSLLQERDGPLWVGTGGAGLYRFENGRFTVHTRTNGLPSNFVRTLHRDADGVLWVGTGSGLGRLEGTRMTSFGRAHGLPDDVISQILEDDRRNLWFGCNQGIFRVASRDFAAVASGQAAQVNAIAYGRADGLESLECTGGFHPAGLKTRDGKLWFSTVKGLVVADPANISVNETPPTVVLEDMVVDGDRMGVDETTGGVPGSIQRRAGTTAESGPELGPGVQRVEFRFTALSLVAPERNRFKYRLEGLDTGWVEAGSQRVAIYPHLPPGRYEFRVIACNNDGIWNESGAALRFAVLPPFWQTWWFRGLAGIVLLGGGGWLVRFSAVYRLRRKLRRLEEKHALETERRRIAQDIHDELGANLTRIALLTELGQKHRDKPDELAADLGKISATAREATRAMDAIVWAVNPRNDSLDHFANYISQFAEEFFRPTSIRCRLDIPADLPEQPLSTEARHHLLLAVKEALNNVVRHSGAAEVWLRVAMADGELTVTIADNGGGIAPAPATDGGHNGLTNIRRRIEDLGGRFELASHAGAGTTLRLHLPLAAPGQTERS